MNLVDPVSSLLRCRESGRKRYIMIRSIKLHTPNDEIIYSLRHSSIEMVCEENTEIDCTYAALS